ncbi:MAG: class I SAM-dependent methyltransferase [Deltaproteobacteria bacterium]|nr:class I SAM-dependent methyltransferase [Deltaproteobacteria bacterium]
MKDIHLVRIPDRGVTERLVTFMDDFVLERAGRGKALLDIGCGRGVFTDQLAERFTTVTGIDIVKEEIFTGTGRNGRGVYSIMDANLLGFKDGVFDIIISRYTFHHLDLKRASPEVKRCLKPGGRFVMVDTEETFWQFKSRIGYFLFGVRRLGILSFLKIVPDLLRYFFKKETIAHRREDILRLKKEGRYTVSDFVNIYKTFFPDAEVGTYRWAGYVLWQKPE